MSTALESLSRDNRLLHHFSKPVYEVIVQGQNDSYSAVKKPELHLIPYRVDTHTYQIGMNGVVEPTLFAINFSEQEAPEGENPSYLSAIHPTQLELPIINFKKWTKFKNFYNCAALAEWALYLNLDHPSQLLRVENMTQLQPSVARHLIVGRTPFSKSPA